MKIKKTKVNGEYFYPATITNAVKDHRDGKTLTEFIDETKGTLNKKQDKESGKSLIEDSEKSKLQAYPVLTGAKTFLRSDGEQVEELKGSGPNTIYFNNEGLGFEPTAQTDISATCTNNEVLIKKYTIDNNFIANSGYWRFNTKCKVSNAEGNTRLRYKVYSNTNLLFTVDSESIKNLGFSTARTEYYLVYNGFKPLVIEVYAVTDSLTSKTVTISNGPYSYLNSPLNFSHDQLRDINGNPDIQHINAKEKVAVEGLTRKAFGYKFDGVDDRVTVNHNDLLNFGSSDFTMEAVINIKAYNGSQSMFICGKSDGVKRFGMYGSASSFSFLIADGTTIHTLTQLKGLQIGKHNHVVTTIKDRIPYIYLNGELVAVGPSIGNSSFDSNADLILQGYSGCLNGNLSLFRLYKRGFDQSDVDYYYNAGRPDLSRLSYADKVNKTSTGCVLELLPENATASKWLDTQNGLDGVTNGAPSINYGNVTPEPYVYPFKKYIGFKKNGNGTGYIVCNMRTNKSGYATIRGGVFINRTTFDELGTRTFLPNGVLTTVAIKLIDNIAEIEIDNPTYIEQSSEGYTSNSPVPYINASELPRDFGASQSLANVVYGNVYMIPRDTTRLSLSSSSADSINGSFIDLPRGLLALSLNTVPNITGNISHLPKKLNYLFLLNAHNGMIGNLSDLGKEITDIAIGGTSEISGDIGTLKGGIKHLDLANVKNYTYNGGIVVSSSVSIIRLRPAIGAFTSAMTDQLLIDLAAQITSSIGIKTIDLRGNCGPRTSKSDAAVEYLQSIGFNVLTN